MTQQVAADATADPEVTAPPWPRLEPIPDAFYRTLAQDMAARIEGAFSERELDEAIAKAKAG